MKRKQKKKFVDLNSLMQQNTQEQLSSYQQEPPFEEDDTIHQQSTPIEDTTQIQPQLKTDSIDPQPSYSQKRKGKGKNNHHMYELNHLAKFRNYDDDPFLDDPEPKPQSIPQGKFYLRPTKKPTEFEYDSLFKVGQSTTTEYPIPNNNLEDIENDFNEVAIQHNIIDQQLIDSYVTMLHETFPHLDRKQIAAKVCEEDFDIDKVVLFYFDQSSMTNSEYTLYENMTISNIQSLSQSFAQEFKHHSLISIEQISRNNAQTHIEKEIKKKCLLEEVNTSNFNEKEYPFLSEEAKKRYYDSLQVSSEYFLDKSINDIQTPEIKSDLMKISKAFPFEDEFVIKWVYYQFMDYSDSVSFLEKKHVNQSAQLKKLMKSSTEKSRFAWNLNEAEQKGNYTYSSPQSDSLDDDSNRMKVMEILCKKPSNWTIHQSNTECLNVNEYQSIRSQLIKQANIAWRAGRGKDAKAIMAKARRYKVIIDELIQKKKVKTFYRNNQQYAIDNMYSAKEQTIDLHGLSYEEAIIILEHKIFDEEEISTKRTLVIITGRGNHSINYQPVLLPKITKWLNDRHGIKAKPDYDKGIITVLY